MLLVKRYIILLLILLYPFAARAACTGPDGVGGDILFNVDHAVMQYCNDTDWIAFPKYDQSPTPFTLTDLTNQAQTTLVTSNTITLNGFDNAVFVNIAGDGSPEFRINGGAWVTTASVVPGDTLQVRMTTAGAGGVTNTASVTVGTYTENWDVSTTGPDTTPNAFSFTDQTGLALSTLAVSNSIIISGINASTPVSVSGDGSPQIRINGGAWVTSGNITSGQSLEVRLTSSASYGTKFSASIDVGGVTDQWDVTTTALLEFLGEYKTNSYTQNFTFNSVNLGSPDASRRIIVVIGNAGDSNVRTASSTIAGVAGTEVVHSGGQYVFGAIHVAHVPTGATGTITVNYSAATVNHVVISVYRMIGLNSNTPVDTDFVNINNPSVTLTVDVPAGSCVIGGARMTANVTYTWSGLDENMDTTISGNSGAPVQGYSAASRCFVSSTPGHNVTVTPSSAANNTHGTVAVFSP